MINALSNLREGIHAAGLEPPEAIAPGKLSRFPRIGECPSNRTGLCLTFDDGIGVSFGAWYSNLSDNGRAMQFLKRGSSS